MNTIAVLMTCHNRVETTLRCLRALHAARPPEGMRTRVFLVDDGCTDGTGDRVRSEFPGTNVIPGSGDLYWAGGMRLAWSVAAKEDPDHYLWLNDDSLLFPDALTVLGQASLAQGSRAILCGAFRSPTTGKLSYGGKREGSGEPIEPDGTLQDCDIVNGNCVWVPRDVFRQLGNFDPVFTHAIADFDYGLRAKARGIPCKVAPVVLGECEFHPSLPRWCRPEVPLRQRLASLYSPLGYAQPGPYLTFVRRHYGIAAAIRKGAGIHLRMLFPRLWSGK